MTNPDSFGAAFGRLVRDYRRKMGLTQAALAALVFSDREDPGSPDHKSSVSRLERGRIANPHEATVESYAHVLDISDAEIKRLRKDAAAFCAIAPDVAADQRAWPFHISSAVGMDRIVLGRVVVVSELRKMLRTSKSVAIVPAMVVKGYAGIGKTTIGRTFVAAYASDYFGVWWINAETEQSIIRDLCGLGTVLRIADKDITPSSLAQVTVDYLRRSKLPWLLVYDNAESAQEIKRWRPTGPNTHVLVTSRNGGWPSNQYQIQPADVLSIEDATDLLMREANRSSNRVQANALANALGCLPLALVIAGGWLRDTPTTTFEKYQGKLTERLTEIPETIGDYELSVASSITLSFDKLSRNAKELMKVIAYFAPDDFWPEMFTVLKNRDTEAPRYNSVPNELWDICVNSDQVELAFAELERRSLIEYKEGTWRVHRLIQFVQRMILGNRAGAWETAAAILAASYPGKEDGTKKGKNVADRTTWGLCQRLNPHVSQLYSISEKNVSSIPFEYLLNQTSLYFAYNNAPDLAAKYATNAPELAARYAIDFLRRKKQRLPANDRTIGGGYHNLSYRLKDLGKPKHMWAMQSSAKAVQIAESNPEILLTSRALWTSHYGQTILDFATTKGNGKSKKLLARARQEIHKALKLVRTPDGGFNVKMQVGLNSLAWIFETQGRFNSAALMFKSSLTRCRINLGGEHVETAKRSSSLGRVLIKSASCQSARPYIIDALRIQEDAYGGNINHPARLSSAKWLATLEFLEGRTAAVESIVSRYPNYLSDEEIAKNASEVRSGWAE